MVIRRLVLVVLAMVVSITQATALETPPAPPAPPPLYDVKGAFAVGTYENSIFLWHEEMYILENIDCGFLDHYGMWNKAFANQSYARIRKLTDGTIVMNISETISHAFISAYPDYEHDRMWLFGINQERCHGTKKGSLVAGFSSTDLLNWDVATAVPNVTTFNVEVAAVDVVPAGMPPHKHVMILEPFQFMINNDPNGDLTQGWVHVDHETPPAPSGGPSIRFSEGYYYLITGGHPFVFILRSKDLKTWENSTYGPLAHPTVDDAKIADIAGFAQDYKRQGFVPNHVNWTSWDWNSNDGDVCCMSPNATESWVVWGASTQGRQPFPPVTPATDCVNVIGHSDKLLPEILKSYFQ